MCIPPPGIFLATTREATCHVTQIGIYDQVPSNIYVSKGRFGLLAIYMYSANYCKTLYFSGHLI